MPGPHAQLDVTVQERTAVRVGDLSDRDCEAVVLPVRPAVGDVDREVDVPVLGPQLGLTGDVGVVPAARDRLDPGPVQVDVRVVVLVVDGAVHVP